MPMKPITEEQRAISLHKREAAQAAWRDSGKYDHEIGLTVEMPADGLDQLDLVAWICDGEGEDRFVERCPSSGLLGQGAG